jgi:hypothetical protein
VIGNSIASRKEMNEKLLEGLAKMKNGNDPKSYKNTLVQNIRMFFGLP